MGWVDLSLIQGAGNHHSKAGKVQAFSATFTWLSSISAFGLLPSHQREQIAETFGERVRDHVLDAGAVGFLRKPFSDENPLGHEEC